MSPRRRADHGSCYNGRMGASDDISRGASPAPGASEDLAAYLGALARADSYELIGPLGRSPDGAFRTELVRFIGARGGSLGPMVRKTIPLEGGLGGAYEVLFAQMRQGRRFRHIPRVIDCYKTGTDLVVVSEYIEGVTLHDHMARLLGAPAATPMDDSAVAAATAAPAPAAPVPRPALEIFPELCDAVEELHGMVDPPLVHRDLKPQNVIVAPEGLFLIDFGIARRVRDDARSDTVKFGTLCYAPPEQYGFGQTDARSDVYALGMLLLYCLVGREPRDRDDAVRMTRRVAHEVSPGMAEVVERATALSPADRFPSAAALSRAFARALSSARPGDGARPTGLTVPAAPGLPRAARPAAERVVAGEEPSPAPTAARRRRRRPWTYASGMTRVFPEGLALAYDVVLGALAVAFVAGTLGQYLHPRASSPQDPVWYSALTAVGFVAPLFVGPLWLIADKRFVARLVPRLARRTMMQDVVAWALVLVIALILLFTIYMVAGL